MSLCSTVYKFHLIVKIQNVNNIFVSSLFLLQVFADATIVLPVLVGETFAKRESEIRAFYKRQEDL